MTRNKPTAAAAVIAVLLLAATAHVSAQGGTANKRTFLAFSAAVQVPGATLPAGQYVFRLANPQAQTIWQVLDRTERHVLATFFDVPTPRRTTAEQNRAGGKPVVLFRETPQGIPPAIRVLYYPTDLYGTELIYPRKQAQLLANATRQPIPATDADATSGGSANVFTVEPETIEARNDASADVTTPQAVEEQAPPPSIDETRPVAPSSTRARTSAAASDRPVGTSGRNEQDAEPPTTAAASQPARKELPGTASPSPIVGLVGLLALAAGVGFRLARRAAR